MKEINVTLSLEGFEPCHLNGPPAAVAAMIDSCLSALRCPPESLELAWHVGAGVEIFTLNSGQTLRENVESALEELRELNVSFDSGPAGEESAIALCNALLAGLNQMERRSV